MKKKTTRKPATRALPKTTITATINVTINQFRPLGGVFPISAVMELAAPQDGIKPLDGSIVVKSGQPATLVFQLTNPAYVFAGVAFDTSIAEVDVGTTEFPRVVIDRDPKRNRLSVIDANLSEDSGKTYNYILLVQNTATGEIGIIDPPITNEPH